jgi:hypothetical protein
VVVFVVLVLVVPEGLVAPVPADGFVVALLVAGFTFVPVAGLAVVLVAGLTVVDVAGFVVVVAAGCLAGDVAGLVVVPAGLTVLPFAGLAVGVVPDARCVLTTGFAVVVGTGRAAGVPVLVPVEGDDLTGAVPVDVAVRLAGAAVLPAGRRIGTATVVVLIESATGRIVGAPIGVYTSVTQPDGLRVCAPPLVYTSTYWPVVFSCKAFWFICLFVASQTLAMCE